MSCDAGLLYATARMQRSSDDLTLTEYCDMAGSKFVANQVVNSAWVTLTEERPFYLIVNRHTDGSDGYGLPGLYKNNSWYCSSLTHATLTFLKCTYRS